MRKALFGLAVISSIVHGCHADSNGFVPVWAIPVAVILALLFVGFFILIYCLYRRKKLRCPRSNYEVAATYERGLPWRISVVFRRAQRKQQKRKGNLKTQPSEEQQLPDVIQKTSNRPVAQPRTSIQGSSAPLIQPRTSRIDSSAPLVSPGSSVSTPMDSSRPLIPSTANTTLIEEVDIPEDIAARINSRASAGYKFSSV